MLRSLALAVLLAPIALAGCDAATPAATEAVSEAPSLGEMRYSCDGPPGFLPSLLDEPANAETEDHPSAIALRTAVAGGGQDLDMLPASGYWLASRDERVAEYVAREPAGAEPAFVSATFENQGGAWKLVGWGQCRPRIVLEGFSPATWTLDPDDAAPAPDTRTFTALVMETACNDGQPMGARLLPPSITYGPDAVLVVFAAHERVGDGIVTCPGNPSTRVMVELREALGDRRLLDAGVFPPAVPVAPES